LLPIWPVAVWNAPLFRRTWSAAPHGETTVQAALLLTVAIQCTLPSGLQLICTAVIARLHISHGSGVAVRVGVAVRMAVGVRVAVLVRVLLGVRVGVAVRVAVRTGVPGGVFVGTGVHVEVSEGAGVLVEVLGNAGVAV